MNGHPILLRAGVPCPTAKTLGGPSPRGAALVGQHFLRRAAQPVRAGGCRACCWANCSLSAKSGSSSFEILPASLLMRHGPRSPAEEDYLPLHCPVVCGAGLCFWAALCLPTHGGASSRPSFPVGSPLQRAAGGGTSLRPQLRLALDQLWVLSGGKEAAGEEEEEAGSDEDRTTLIFIWPTGSCIADFGSRALKELWVGTLLGTPEGAKRARVTRLPSLKLLEKELSRRHAWRTVSVRSLERLMEGQAEADPKQGPPPVPAGNGGGLCRSPGEFWKERQLLASG
ncbi:uncharacterized protein J5F26_002861 [Ciconia maguari]